MKQVIIGEKRFERFAIQVAQLEAPVNNAPLNVYGAAPQVNDASFVDGPDNWDRQGSAPAQRSVRAGDYRGSLERIARSELGPNASQREINNYVGQLFEINNISNARAIGAERSILLPGASTAAATSGLGLYGRDIAIGEAMRERVIPLPQASASYTTSADVGVGATTSIPGSINQIADGVFADIAKQRELEARIAKYGEWKETPYNFARDNIIGRATLGAAGDLYAATVGKLLRDDGLAYNPISNTVLTPREEFDTKLFALTSLVPIGRGAAVIGAFEKSALNSVGSATVLEGAALKDAVATRQATARAFYESAGWSEKRIAGHLDGIDFSKSVEVITLPRGTLIDQFHEPGKRVGNYFSPIGTPVESRGMDITGRVNGLFEVRQEVQVLRSTASNMPDWKGSGKTFNGGATQYFAPNQTSIVRVPGQ